LGDDSSKYSFDARDCESSLSFGRGWIANFVPTQDTLDRARADFPLVPDANCLAELYANTARERLPTEAAGVDLRHAPQSFLKTYLGTNENCIIENSKEEKVSKGFVMTPLVTKRTITEYVVDRLNYQNRSVGFPPKAKIELNFKNPDDAKSSVIELSAYSQVFINDSSSTLICMAYVASMPKTGPNSNYLTFVIHPLFATNGGTTL